MRVTLQQAKTFTEIDVWALVFDNTVTPEDLDPPEQDKIQEVDSKLYTEEQQNHINKVVEERVARSKKQNRETIKELQILKSTVKMNDDQRKKLELQIDNLDRAHMTEKELSVKQRKADSDKHDKAVTDLSKERDTWKSLFEDSTIQREILDAASSTDTKAYNPSQIVSLLLENTTLVEETVDGVNTGKFVTRVKFSGRDSENKPLVMDLSVREAVDEMSKMREHTNLFESGLKNGLGKNNVPGSSPLSSASYGNQESYRKNREKIVKG